jgi:outer membrane protein
LFSVCLKSTLGWIFLLAIGGANQKNPAPLSLPAKSAYFGYPERQPVAMARYYCVFLALLTSVSAIAQSSDPPPALRFTLSECVDYAVKNNLSVRQSGWDVVQSEVALQQSKADLLPSVNANTSVSYSVGRTINQFTNDYVEAPVRQQDIGVTAQLPLFSGLRRLNTIKRNRIGVGVSELDLAATKNDVTLDVIAAYTQILLNIELLETTQFQQRTVQSQLQRSQRLVEAGSVPQADALQFDAQLAQREVAVVDAENNLALAQLQLKQLLQIPAEQSLEVVIPEVDVPEEAQLPASAEVVYDQAVANLPAIRSADQQITGAEYGIAIARADYYPSLSLVGGLGSSYSSLAPPTIPRAGSENIIDINPNPIGFINLNGERLDVLSEVERPEEFVDNTYLNQLDFNLRRFVQLRLDIPIFNNWQVRSNVANAKIQLENAQINALSQRNVVRQNIEQAYLDAKSAAKSYTATQRQVASLQEAFKNTEARYQAGAIDAVDYNQAQNDLNGAESDLVRTKYNYVFSLKVLDFYQGNPLTF